MGTLLKFYEAQVSGRECACAASSNQKCQKSHQSAGTGLLQRNSGTLVFLLHFERLGEKSAGTETRGLMVVLVCGGGKNVGKPEVFRPQSDDTSSGHFEELWV